jgi:hypothetical protein
VREGLILSKEVVGALVGVGLLAPYLIGRSAPGIASHSKSALMRLVVILLYLASVGLFVAMGFKGGDTFHSSFWGYWLIGGWLIYNSYEQVIVVAKPSRNADPS